MKMMIMKRFEALEEERKKIQVFRRELPLCLELVNEAIEKCKKEMQYHHGEKSDCEEGDEEILNNEGPVLEQFLPLKRTNSSSFEKQQQEQKNTDKIDEKKKNLGMKVDWLKSVQLWTADPPLKQDFLVENSTKIELKKCGGGGAFQPFQSEATKGGNTNSIISTTPPTTTANSIDMSNNTPSSVAATTSSTADNNNNNSTSSNGNKRKKSGDEEEKDNDLRRKTRRCWSPELHKRFLEALQQLGGSHVATPKQIKELMKVDGLTNDEVKSHLQKYRIHTRGGVPNSAATHNSQHQPPPQFVVVGGIWVPPPPPPEYATTMEGATEAAGTKRMNTNDMYVAVSAQQVAGSQQQQQQQQKHQSPTGSLHSEGRSKRGDHSSVDDVHSSSPSSSTETTTTTSSSKHVK